MAGPIVVAVQANVSQAQNALGGVESTAQRVGRGFRRMAAPATAALGAIAVAAKGAVSSASDQAEAVSRNAVVFGRQGDEIERFADRAANALGQSKTQALDAAATFGQIGQKAGLSGRQTSAFAQQFTTLASDLASFNNTTPEEAIEAIGAAMRGESEPIRKYGVLLDDATLRARALKLGLVQTTSQALKPQQKALAASAEILAQTGKAQGDFARTSDGAANKSRIVAAQVENLQASLGQALLPAYEKVLGVGLRVVGFFQQNQTVAKVLVGVLAALAVSILAVNAAMLLNPAVLIVAGLVALGAALVVAYQRSETFRRIVQQVAQFIQTSVIPALRSFWQFLKTQIIPVVVETAQKVAARLKPILTALANFVRGSLIPVVQKVAAKFREWWPTIQRIIVVVVKLYGKWLQFVAMVAGKVIPVVIRFAGFVLRTVVPAVIAWVSTMARIIGKIIDFGRKVVNAVQSVARFVRGVKQKFDEALAFIRSIPGKVTDALGDLGSLLLDAGRELIEGLIDGITSKFGDVQDALGGLTGKITDWKGPPKRDAVLLRPAGRMVIAGFVDGINDGAAGVRKVLGKITDLVTEQTEARIKNDKAAKAAIRSRLKSLRDEYAALIRNGKAQDKVAKSLEAARTKAADLRRAYADTVNQIRDQVIAAASITSLGEGTGYSSVDQMLSILRGKVAQSEAYTAMIERLRKAGLNRDTLDQLIQAGAEAGTGAASALLSGGAAAIREYNRLQARLRASGTALGTGAADSLYKAGISAADALVRQLERQAARLDRLAERMGTRLVQQVNRLTRGGKPERPGKGAAVALAGGTGKASTTNNYRLEVKVAPGANAAETGRQIVRAIEAYEKAGGRRKAS